MPEAQAMRIPRLFVQAVRESNLSLSQKLGLRLAYLAPSVRSAIDDYINELVVDEATALQTDPSAMADGTIIKIILEHLPEIMKLIELIIGLL